MKTLPVPPLLLLLLLLVARLNCSSEPLLLLSRVQDGFPGTHQAWLDPSLSEVVPSRSSSSARALDRPGPVAEAPEVWMFPEHVNLQWRRFQGSPPNGAVAIFNGYSERTEYVCKVHCEAGFYSDSEGDYCYYPYADREYRSSEFEILVNVDHFEFLVWTEDSHGSVPGFSVRTCSDADVFVGKNKYGLGKVVPQHEAFFLPWEGHEYWYKTYQVLGVNRDAYSQHISHVEYLLDDLRLLHQPPEALQLARVTNLQCTAAKKNVRLEKTTSLEKHWDIGRETRNGSTSTMTATVPILGPGLVDFTEEQTLSFSEGTRTIESIRHTVEVEILVPPNHSCAVRMDGRKMAAELPFKARLSRTNRDGDTRWTSISGTYSGVNVGEINAVVERCRPLSDATPCPPQY